MKTKLPVRLLKALLVTQLLALTALGTAVWLKTYCPVFYVTSDSMHPSIPQGSLIVISNRWAKLAELQEKPVVFFEPLRRRIVVHRVLSVQHGYLSTRGDNNVFVDSYRVSRENILGRVVFSWTLFGEVGRLVLVLAGLVLVLGWLLK